MTMPGFTAEASLPRRYGGIFVKYRTGGETLNVRGEIVPTWLFQVCDEDGSCVPLGISENPGGSIFGSGGGGGGGGGGTGETGFFPLPSVQQCKDACAVLNEACKLACLIGVTMKPLPKLNVYGGFLCGSWCSATYALCQRGCT
jgi:hypothetical protein